MAMHNPKGRANYEPNSWGGEAGGPRENPETGYKTFPAEVSGLKERVRSEKFADHYSQARQFYKSQTEVEQTHIQMAITFELSKVETPVIRSRVVSHLLNIDTGLAKAVAKGLGLEKLPEAAPPARAVVDLPPSPALSILKNGPKSFAGRKIGVLATNGADGAVLEALQKAAKAEGAEVEIVAPQIGGITTSDGKHVPAAQRVPGGPSVLFDAVILLPSEEGARQLAQDSDARDFVTDAYAHAKFIGYAPAALPLLKRAGVVDDAVDDGVIALKAGKDAEEFVKTCRELRFWPREASVHAV